MLIVDGKWKGKQVVSEEWVKLATRKQTRFSGGGQHYGFCWFPGSRWHKGKKIDYVASFGYGGQTLYLIPEKDLIIIFTCELAERGGEYLSIPVQKTFDAIYSN